MSERPTPETDDQPIINAINDNGYQVPCVDIDFARKLERERNDYKCQLHIAKGEIAEARKMERAWKKEETK